MKHPIHRVTSFEQTAPYTLQVKFDDGLSRVIDLEPVLHGELFGPLRDPAEFARVRLDAEVKTLVWPSGADFDPAVLHDWPEHEAAFRAAAKRWNSALTSAQRTTVDDSQAPRFYKGVMVSSTFADLDEHRAALIRIIESRGLKAIPMEYDSALPAADVIDSSLGKVRDGSAYVGIIAKRYGQIPPCPKRNPRNVSITELEFDEAVKLKRPILLFLMGSEHLVRESDIETKPASKKKLKAFRERAKEMGPDQKVHRVYATFDGLEQFKEMAAQSVDALCRYLEAQAEANLAPERKPPNDGEATEISESDRIPSPPLFYAEPAYLGSHEFVGRREQLATLNEWALPADSHPVLLFEAIGGTGKSMLTWEWVRNHAPLVRPDWKGRFWYSFYERGAIMTDFCQRALAYMTGQPLEKFRKMKTAELAPQLLHELRTGPWLFVLDGLERVLVTYNRIDAAQLPDEKAGQTDEIGQRDPCAAIRPDDDTLLRALTAAAPSKLLLTSRLVPRVLLNQASQPIPGVQRVPLPGLRPADAEALFRASGVTGESKAIQAYLKTHCDCHPLTIGVLAGLVNDYLPNRGNFDQWSADPDGGGKLNLAELDLIQKRNHILLSAVAALSPASRKLLSMVALLSEAVNYETLKALYVHTLPEMRKPSQSGDEGSEAKKGNLGPVERRRQDERAAHRHPRSSNLLSAPKGLAETIKDLEDHGLLQYDTQAKHYDLHPVVRGVASGALAAREKKLYGQRVVDHFSALPHNPYEQAETLEDVRDGLRVVHTLLQMGRFQEASDAYRGDLSQALIINLEAFAEVAAVVRPFFPSGWRLPARNVEKRDASYLGNDAAIALAELGQNADRMAVLANSVALDLESEDWPNTVGGLINLGNGLVGSGRLAKADVCVRLAIDLASLGNDAGLSFASRLYRFALLARLGQWNEAEASWRVLDPLGRDWNRTAYQPGNAEALFALSRFWKGELQEEDLVRAKQLALAGRNRMVIRLVDSLRGEWRLEQGEWQLAAESLHEAVQLARAVGQVDQTAETQLVLAKLHLGQIADARDEAKQLSRARRISDRALAQLWIAIGDQEQAKKHALVAYKKAWADGEPYVFRYELNKSRALLEQLGVQVPILPPYDPINDEKLPWEDAVMAALKKLRTEQTQDITNPGNSEEQTW